MLSLRKLVALSGAPWYKAAMTDGQSVKTFKHIDDQITGELKQIIFHEKNIAEYESEFKNRAIDDIEHEGDASDLEEYLEKSEMKVELDKIRFIKSIHNKYCEEMYGAMGQVSKLEEELELLPLSDNDRPRSQDYFQKEIDEINTLSFKISFLKKQCAELQTLIDKIDEAYIGVL